MGSVYLAEHRVMDRQVALKVIRSDLLGKPALVERFRREVKSAAHLPLHANIVAAYDAEQAGDSHFLVMEFVDGVNLGDLVKSRGPLPYEAACDAIRQAAEGLEHAHQRGMVHRDIKPQNLMRTSDGQIKILDFGLARLVSEVLPDLAAAAEVNDERQARSTTPDGGIKLTLTDMVLGSADYIAPEQALDPRSADIRADIYSLGCTLYHLLAGLPPFPEGNLAQKLAAHAERAPMPLSELRPDVPPEVVQTVDRMMAKDRSLRFQRPTEVCEALGPFSDRKGEQKHDDEPRERKRAGPSRVEAKAALLMSSDDEVSKKGESLTVAVPPPRLGTQSAPPPWASQYSTYRRGWPLVGVAAVLSLLVAGAGMVTIAVVFRKLGYPGGAQRVVSQLKDATVYVKAKFAGKILGSGSGFVIESNRESVLVVTNRHIADPDLSRLSERPAPTGTKVEIEVVFHSGEGRQLEQTLPAEIVAVDTSDEIIAVDTSDERDGDVAADLAFLVVRGVSHPPEPIDPHANVDPSERMAYSGAGFPQVGTFGKVTESYANPSVTITNGSISTFHHNNSGQLTELQVVGSPLPYDSGGPIVEEKTGRLIGVVARSGQTIISVVPPEELRRCLAGRVGAVQLKSLDTSLTTALEIKTQVVDPKRLVRGVLVGVAPAAGAGSLAPNSDGSWPPLSNTPPVELKKDEKTSTASGRVQVSLRGARAASRKILVQLAHRNSSGQVIYSKPSEFELPEKQGLVIASSSSEAKPARNLEPNRFDFGALARRPVKVKEKLDKILASPRSYAGKVVIPAGMYEFARSQYDRPDGPRKCSVTERRFESSNDGTKLYLIAGATSDLGLEPRLAAHLDGLIPEQFERKPAILTLGVTEAGDCGLVAVAILQNSFPRLRGGMVPDIVYETLTVGVDGPKPARGDDRDWESERVFKLAKYYKDFFRAQKRMFQNMQMTEVQSAMTSIWANVMREAAVQEATQRALQRRHNRAPPGGALLH